MNLPPRLPPPTFAPDLADVTIVVAAARRRRARQSGVAGLMLTALLAGLIAVNGGGTIRLSEQHPASSQAPVAPGAPSVPQEKPASAAERGTAASAPAGTAGPARPSATAETPPRGTASHQGSAALPKPGRALRYDWAVVDDRPDVPCDAMANGALSLTDPQGPDRHRCVRWWWTPRTPYARGMTFVQELCVVDESPEEVMNYGSPGMRVGSNDYEFVQGANAEHVELVLSPHTCLRWTVDWDGSGRPAGDNGHAVAGSPAEFLPPDTYYVRIAWSAGGPSTTQTVPKSVGWSMTYSKRAQETFEVT